MRQIQKINEETLGSLKAGKAQGEKSREASGTAHRAKTDVRSRPAINVPNPMPKNCQQHLTHGLFASERCLLHLRGACQGSQTLA
eukprot:6214220-Pleurochrysis_carterae.AAC.1